MDSTWWHRDTATPELSPCKSRLSTSTVARCIESWTHGLDQETGTVEPCVR
jgi:hypothetical protein